MDLNTYNFSKTYGNSPAAKQLAHMLSSKECDKTTKKVQRFFSNYNEGISQIKKIDNVYFRKRLLEMWKKEKLQDIEKIQNVDNFVKSFMKCVAVTKCRVAMREI